MGGVFLYGYCSVIVGLKKLRSVTPKPATGAKVSPMAPFLGRFDSKAAGAPSRSLFTSQRSSWSLIGVLLTSGTCGNVNGAAGTWRRRQHLVGHGRHGVTTGERVEDFGGA